MTSQPTDALSSSEQPRKLHALPSSSRRSFHSAAGWPVVALVMGLVAGALVVAGVLLPWVSTFAGLISLAGTASSGGGVLLALGALTAVATLILLFRRDVRARWAVGGLGFVTVVYAGYLLLNLVAAVRAADSMALPSVGPGLPVVLAGGGLALATLFLPDGSNSRNGADRATAQQPTAGKRLRYLGALLAVTAAVAHVPVTPAHLHEAPYIGIGFLLLTAALLLLATGLLISGSRRLWVVLAAVCAAAVLAYVVSRTVGLPLIGDDVGNWLEPLGVLSVVTETFAAVTAVLALRSSRRLAQSQI